MKDSYLASTKQTWKLIIAYTLICVGGGLIIIGFILEVNVSLIFTGTCIGIVGIIWEFVSLKCKKCGTNLGWKRMNGKWKYSSHKCPVCNDGSDSNPDSNR